MSAPRSTFNALDGIGAAAALGATVWWWSEFSGPFRWLIDLQVRLTGRFYWEPPAVALVLTALLFAVVVVGRVFGPLVSGITAKAWVRIGVVVVILASGAALAQAWRLWTAPEGPTRQYPPLQVIDLDHLDTPFARFGPVRLIGVADRKAQVKLHLEPRGYHVYQPLQGRHRAARDMPVPVIAVCYSRYASDCIPEALDGWLSPGAYDDRDSYWLRRAGVLTTPHYYWLTPGLPPGDSYVEASARDRSGAVDILLILGFFWGVTIFTLIKAPPSRFPPPPAAAAPVSPATIDDTPGENLYLLPLYAGGFIFVLLSAISVVIWIIRLIP